MQPPLLVAACCLVVADRVQLPQAPASAAVCRNAAVQLSFSLDVNSLCVGSSIVCPLTSHPRRDLQLLRLLVDCGGTAAAVCWWGLACRFILAGPRCWSRGGTYAEALCEALSLLVTQLEGILAPQPWQLQQPAPPPPALLVSSTLAAVCVAALHQLGSSRLVLTAHSAVWSCMAHRSIWRQLKGVPGLGPGRVQAACQSQGSPG